MTKTILIFRIGSIGDTVVALPCFHQISRAFPGHRRVLITDVPVGQKAAAAESILRRGTLIDDVIYFPPPPRKGRDLLALRRRIRETGAATLVYVADREIGQTLRDLAFFYACGIRRIIGAPLRRNMRKPQVDPLSGETEREALRLARCLKDLGPIDLDDPKAWDLQLQPDEVQAAQRALGPLHSLDFLAVSIGGKDPRKDWGDANWAALLRILAASRSHLGLAFVGAADEAERCQRLAKAWSGPTLNLCGLLTPRESAAAMQQAVLYLGHDNGPMHLAASVGTQCVAMFGNVNMPRWWHPMGPGHHIIHDTRGLRFISPEQVAAATAPLLVSVETQNREFVR